MLKYIFAFIVVAAIWAAALVIRFPHAIEVAIAVTVLVVLILVALFAYRKYRARKAAREIEKALNAQAEEHARSVRPEQQAEVRAMQSEFARATSMLKSSKLGKSGVEALYALPWYVIIGPPGAGKTTALTNSGLQFPYLGKENNGIRGVGGTRNCTWFLSNEAVLLDTAGRYTTVDDDRDEWISFLDLIKNNRPEKPLNGLLVAVSVPELVQANEAEIDRIARRVRERVDEVQGHLKMVLPVYVLFTKIDLVQGFSEFYNDLRKNERGQIWGFTVPMAAAPGSPGAYFGERFDELQAVTEKRMWTRLAAERRIEDREAIYQFPQQFSSVRQSLADFLESLFQTNAYQGAPLFRGAYFTSGTQEGRPIDRLTAKLRETLGLPQPSANPQQQVTEAKSFFLRDVFARVVFPDADLAVRSAEELSRQRRKRLLVAAGALVSAGLISILPLNAYFENIDLVRAAGHEADTIAQHATTANAPPLTLVELNPVRSRVEQLRAWEDGTTFIPPTMRFGMYKGAELYPRVSQLYAMALRRHVIEPLARRDVNDMRQFVAQHPGTTPPGAEARGRFYNTLKLHLLLTTKAANEPDTSAQREYLTQRLTETWVGRLPAEPSAADRAAIQSNAAAYVAQLADHPEYRLARENPVVVSTRSVLNRASLSNLAIRSLIEGSNALGCDITLATALGRSPGDTIYQVPQRNPALVGDGDIPVSDHTTVRCAFTRQGWEGHVRDRLRTATDDLAGEPWVLGQAVNQQQLSARTLETIRSEYFRLYINEWRTFVEGLRVRDPGNPENALQMLQWMTQGGAPPYEFLMRTVADNTSLYDPQEAATGAAGSTLMAAAAQAANSRLQSQGRTGMAASQAAQSAMQAANGQRGNAIAATVFIRESVERDPLLKGLVDFGVPPQPPPPPAAQAGQPPAPAPAPSGPTAMREYLEQLALVRDALQTFLMNPNAPPTPLLTALQTAQTRTSALIVAGAVDSRQVLNNLLPPPINFTVNRTQAALAGGSSDRWCTAVVVPFYRTLGNRYPFDPSGQDAAIADVADFYRPTRGALWAFYTETLATEVPRVGEEFTFSTRLGNNAEDHYRPELRAFLNRSQDISSVLFAAGADQPGVDFEIRIRATPTIAETQFTVDGTTVVYTNGPEEWHRFHWPGGGGGGGAAAPAAAAPAAGGGGGATRGAKIRVRGLNGVDETIEQEGEWGLFRLFEQGIVRGSPEARIFSVVWRLRDQRGIDNNAFTEIGVDVRPARSENPFFGVPRRDNANRVTLLRPFRGEDVNAPHPIARAGRPCNLSGVPGAPAPAARSEEDGGRRRHRRRSH